jgi:hypothetical protein
MTASGGPRVRGISWENRPSAGIAAAALAAAAAALAAAMLFGNLAHPLLWADEAETAMFARHVREYGYPKVHGARNVVYQFGPNIAVGVKEGPDAYIGTTWGQFYFAVPGLVWAGRADDLYDRTFRLRLPFALAGAAGVLVWLAALLPVFAGEPRRKLRFAAAYLLAIATSVSLLLHLREVRYYALVVLLSGAIFRLHLAYTVYGRARFAGWAAGLAALLFLLFHTFFQAFFAFLGLLAAERLAAVARGRAPRRDLVPFAVAALAVAPFAVWFETFSTAAAFAESFAFRPADYAANLWAVVGHLLRHEWLAAALVLRAGAFLLRAGSPQGRRVASGLLGFAAGSVALGCLNPLALERYFVMLSPLLIGASLLDAFALARALPERVPAPRRRAAAAATVAGLAVLVAASRWPDAANLRGRLHELAVPYRGPLDFAIPWLRETYPHPEALVIATNYEEYAFMYYLGSHAIIGLSLNNLARDRQLEPDVVIPRRRWPRSLAELRPLLARGEWEEVRFPVRDVHHNNVPALSRSRFLPDPHRFETPATADPAEQLVLYRRASSANRTGTSSRP